MIHLVVTAASWGPEGMNYIAREKQKYVEVCKQMWYLEESCLSHKAARILSRLRCHF